MGINGSVSDDLKWFYPDKTGFMFDTPPMNVANGRGAYYTSVHGDFRYYGYNYLSIPWNKTGGKYFDEDEHRVVKYNGVLNWLHKYEIDNRFLALSDKNATLNQFPEVQNPWKFTEYVFMGMGSGYEVVEPPLYDPSTLIVINGVENPANINLKQPGNEHFRKEGKISGNGYDDIHYEPVYYYRCKFSNTATDQQIKDDIPVLGPPRKQYEPDEHLRKVNGDLESGLIVDGKVYPPWTDPVAHFRYKNTFINTQELCGTRKVFKYSKPNRGANTYFTEDSVQGEKIENVRYTGIRLYRKDILAKCISMGQHGNIPPFTINMSAPKDYIDPATMYRNAVEVIVTYEAGQAMYAEDDGFVHYKGSGNYYNTDVTISSATFGEPTIKTPENKDGIEWQYRVYNATVGSPIFQPKPNNFGAKFKEKCYGKVPSDISNGKLVHRGCPFFVGDENNGCYCSVKKDMLMNGKSPLTHPSDFAGIFGKKITNESDEILFDPGVQDESPSLCMSSGDNPPGASCRMYAQQGPREILEFMCEEMTDEEFANSIGYNQTVDAAKTSASAAMGVGVTGFVVGMAVFAFTPQKIEGQTTTLNGMSLRKKVRYEYKEVNLNGKEITGKITKNNDTRDVVPGSGKFAIDKKDTSAIGGVDTIHFDGTNLLSRTRFCSPVMQCYNAKYCNKVYGTLNLSSGEDSSTFAGVGSDNHYCRYYNGGCPTTEVHQRAREYDREYRKLLELVLAVFRSSGVRGFSGLAEVRCGNVYAAVGNCPELSSIASIQGSSGNVYFIYDKSLVDAGHINSNVFAFITQYPAPTEGSSLSEDSYYKMNRKKYPLMNILPTEVFGDVTELPWLVKLHDDYVSPTKFESYATNLRRFIGGRMPEYKDFTKMGEEIQCTVTEIQEGYDGSLTSGKGGLDENNDYTTSTSYRYHRVDASGEWIIEDLGENGDGISVGEDSDDGRKHGEARGSLPPSKSNGATPIKGSYNNSSYSQEKGQIKAVMTRGWCFSNDNRKSLEEDVTTVDDGTDEPRTINNAKPPEYCLPLERDWYYCPSCSPKPYSYYQAGDNYDEITNTNTITGELNINQIFTDFEYQQYVNCPRCGGPLAKGSKMKHFAKCRAQGIVNYFGLPGELIDVSGFFWKNHTEVSRTFISEILSKNGSIIEGVYKRNDAATGETESVVEKIFGKGENYVKGYMTEEKRIDMLNNPKATGLTANSSYYSLTNTRASETPYVPSFMRNNLRMDGLGVYHDRYVSPYPLGKTDLNGSESNNGMDFVSANAIKSLRNMVMPWQAYPCYDNGVADTRDIKQSGHKDRFTEEKKSFSEKREGLPSIVLASNDARSEMNFVQFWDGTLIPGKCVRAYYPTSPLWWYRHDSIGGITRGSGREAIHFNDTTNGLGGSAESGYGGNVKTISFHSLQGWLPLDKEVVGAIFSFGMSYQPDCPPVGRTQQGGPMHDKHWHSFTSLLFEDGMGQNHRDYDAKMLADVMGWSDDVNEEGNSGGESLSDGNYTPLNYNGEQYVGGENVISKYSDETFGFGISQDWLDWKGFGEDIIQKATEESIWKKYTFEEFKNIENQYTYDVNFEIGDPTEKDSVQGVVSYIPKPIADGLINNLGQGITNMFDLSGLNSSGIFDKNGMEFAEKTFNTDWAEGGQVIVQADDKTTEINRSVAVLGQPYKADVTKFIRNLYNDRIEREFIATTGTPYTGIADRIREDKINYKGNDGEYDKYINYRHYNQDIGGYWLNSMAFFPELEDGEFPTIDDGMEYVVKPLDICDMNTCGQFYLEIISNEDTSNSASKDYTKDMPEYYKFSPHALCFYDSDGKPSAAAFDNNFKIVTGDWSTCKMMSSNINDLYFVMNISGYPTQTSHRPYRYESGSWNVSNAVCPNPDCFVHKDGVSVAEAAALSSANKPSYRNYLFSLYGETCGACRTSLINTKGAIYTGGDGIETWEYKDIPAKDCIINGFVVDIDNTICKNGFDIYGKSSTDNYWEKLVTVDYDYDSNNYMWKEYYGFDFITKIGDKLPVFKGIWKDGYNAAKESLTGYHFLAKRCNKIKVVGKPCRRRSNGEYLPNGGRVEEVTDILKVKPYNIVDGSRTSFKTGFNNLVGCEGSTFEVFLNDIREESKVFSSEIRSYNQETRTLGLANEIPWAIISSVEEKSNSKSSSNQGENSENEQYYYRIVLQRYIFTIKKLQVYGLELCDNVKITEDANSCLLPVQKGVVSLQFYDRASKMLRVMAVNGNASLYQMEDTGTSTAKTSDDLRYYVSLNYGTNKYEIIKGEYFYDTYSNLIYLPYKCAMFESGADVEEIDNIYTSDRIDLNTVPNAIDIKYMTNAGASVDLPIQSVGEGPSYALEKDTITEITQSSLPKIGSSVFFRKKGERIDMRWMATNKNRTIYYPKEPSLTGLELASKVATHSNFKEFIGGNDETENGINNSKNFLFNGKVKGEITLTGLPNCIISGILCIKAPAMRTRTYVINGNNVTIKERTGGMKRTGFTFCPKVEVRAPDASGQKLACLAGEKPTLIVYLSDRDITEDFKS